MIANATASAASRAHDLLQGGSDLLDLGLLAARSSAAARRLSHGGELDEADRRSLLQLADLFDSSAKVVEFFESRGRLGAPPSGSLAARVDVAIEAVTEEGKPAPDPHALAVSLRKLADDVRRMVHELDQSLSVSLVEVFSALASAVLRETGHVGEVATSF